jgi:hypothetical protein
MRNSPVGIVLEHSGAALIRECILSKLSRGAIRIGKQVRSFAKKSIYVICVCVCRQVSRCGACGAVLIHERVMSKLFYGAVGIGRQVACTYLPVYFRHSSLVVYTQAEGA